MFYPSVLGFSNYWNGFKMSYNHCMCQTQGQGLEVGHIVESDVVKLSY